MQSCSILESDGDDTGLGAIAAGIDFYDEQLASNYLDPICSHCSDGRQLQNLSVQVSAARRQRCWQVKSCSEVCCRARAVDCYFLDLDHNHFSFESVRFVRGQFFEYQESTIGAAFLTQTVALNDTTVKFEIWDTAGQERYHSLAPM